MACIPQESGSRAIVATLPTSSDDNYSLRREVAKRKFEVEMDSMIKQSQNFVDEELRQYGT